jgi:chemotaxis protein methyltransferase CheR
VASLQDDTYQRIAALMHEAIGVSFPASKKPLVSSRLGPRIQRLGLGGYEDYLALLCADDDGGEFQVAVDLLTTNETYFFREPAHFDVLEREILARRPGSMSVWSAASSFGDEAYSVAMLLSDLQSSGRLVDGWSVLGTDISDRVLRSAIAAVYPEERLRAVDADRLRRYCLRGEGESSGLVKIVPRLCEHVRFGQLNLARPIAGIGPFDAIFLRNVLIYFDTPAKTDIVDRVLEHLRPEGLFFIGTAEGRVPCRTALTCLGPGVFRKNSA